jgi:hypothetical protein
VPRDIPNFREWAAWADHLEEFGTLRENESPRGLAVLARAYLEDALDTALLSAALKDLGERRTLTRAVGQELKRKIEAWVKYAKLSDVEGKTLHFLRAVGNEFAHRPRLVSFSDPEVQRIVQEYAKFALVGPVTRYSSPDWEKETVVIALKAAILSVVNPVHFRDKI